MRKNAAEDHELMRALIREDSGALERIIEKWERPLFSFAFRYTQNEFVTRDIVQETFVRIFTKRDSYDFSYPLASWIFTIAANLCKNRARWQKRHPEVSLDTGLSSGDGGEEASLLEVVPAEASLPAEDIEKEEDLDLLKRAVMSLPHDLRTAVLLHHYQDLSYKEIAEVVGCSARGVETRLYRARKILRQRVQASVERDESSQKKKVRFETRTLNESLGQLSCSP
ncbi:RNA polymerase sigma factor [Pelagicoccus mobilis]|uniref:RNA polymerase sigma factor n=1 Tax=Pelagicoccus mobilis TaxID=415221 RepID=A0A934RX42_9BACT|nr:RNA polymerase sigma factor [Pelagicoccus mobilis]MBK1876391.1 RNA polymerase sigma factor [Pelagicoccus mobilis]